MKKALLLIATLMLALSCVFACSKKPEAHKHTLTHHDAVAATCIATGSVAYDECSGCHKKFDAEGNEIEDVTVAINPANHTELAEHTAAPASCIATGTIYYKECNGCHKKYDAEGNEITNIVDPVNPTAHRHLTEHAAVAATCIAAGNVYYKECDDCHKKYDKDGVEITDVVIAIKQHSLTSVPAKESTCTVQGNIAHNHCSVCEKDFDDDGNELESVKLPLNEHTLGDWESDEDGHYKVCSVCTGKFEEEGHTLGASATVDYQKGDHYYTCTVCKYQKHEAHNWSAWTKKDDSDHTRNCTVCQRRETGSHEVGTAATCKDPAVCKLCNGSYGPVSEEHHLDSNGTCTVCGRNRAVWNKSYSGVTVDMYGKVTVSKNAVFTFGADGNSAGAKGAVVGKENGSIEEEEDWYEETITRYLISNAIMYVRYDDKTTGKVALVYAYDRAEETYYNSNKWKTPTHTEKTMTGYIDAATGIIFLDDNHKYTATVLIPSDTPFTADKFEGGAFNTRDYYGVAFYKFTVGDKSVTVYYGAKTGFGGVLFNATVTDFEGNSVAIADFATAPAMIVKDKDGNVIKSFGYNGTTVVELDSYAGKYTGTFGEVLIDGLGNITVTVDGEKQKGKYVAVDFTDHNFEIFFYGEDGETVVDYYEILADLSAYTYTGKHPEITITFDLGDYGDNFTGKVGKKVAYTLPDAPAPTDESYIFKGWLYTTDDGDVTYQPGDVVAFTSDVTLIANWQRKTAITVDLGDGNTVIVYAGEEESLKDVLAAKVTLPDGKTLKHWACAGNPIDGEAVVGADAITITAVYKAQYTLTVVYGNGLENKTYTLLEDEVTAPEEPAYTNGKNFDHWYTSDDEGVTEAEVFEVGSVLTKDTTIYAAWVECHVLTGEWQGFEAYGSNFEQPYLTTGKTASFGTDGKAESGNRISGTTAVYDSQTNILKFGSYYGYYDPESDILVYNDSTGTAKMYDVYIMFRGYKNVTTTRADYFLLDNKYVKLIDVTLTNNDDSEQTITVYFANNKVQRVTWTAEADKSKVSDLFSLKAGWSSGSIKTELLNIYNLDGDLIAQWKKSGSKMALLDGTQGTYTSDNGGEDLVLDGIGNATIGEYKGTSQLSAEGSLYTLDVYMTENGVKVYYEVTLDMVAHTYSINKPMVTISFELNTVDGVDMGAYDSISVNKNVSISLSTLTKPEKEGYVFKGWYSDSALSNVVTSITPSGDTVLYAKWNETYSVSFETELGTAPASKVFEKDSYCYYGDRPQLTADGYVFRGWYVKGDETQKIITGGYKITGNTVFVAKWEVALTLTIVYNKDGKEDVLVYVGSGDKFDLDKYKPEQATDGKVFDAWYSDAACETKFTDTSITENTIIYCGWKEPHALYGEYKGANYDPSDSSDDDTSNTSHTSKFSVDANGKVLSGSMRVPAGNTAVLNDDGTLSFTGSSTYNGGYDLAHGIFYFDYQTGKTEPYHDIYVFFKTVGSVTVSSSVGSSWEKGCTKLFKATYSDNSTLDVFIYNRHIYGGVTFVAKAADGTAITDISKVYSADNVYVLDANGNYIAGFKKNGSALTFDASIAPESENTDANAFAGLTFSGTYTGRADSASHNVQFVFDDASDITGTLIVNDTIKAKFTATFANGELVMTVTENVSGAEDFVGKTLTATLSGKTFSIISCAFGGDAYSLANAGTLTCAEYNA